MTTNLFYPSYRVVTSDTLEFEQGGLGDLLPVTHPVQRQSSFPLIRRGKDHHRPPAEACEQLQLVTPCGEEDVALKRDLKKRLVKRPEVE